MTKFDENAPNLPSFLRRDDAAAYIRDNYCVPCTRGHLAKLATIGGGPAFRKAGRYPVYAKDDLDAWMTGRLSKRVMSTSELEMKGGRRRSADVQASMEAA